MTGHTARKSVALAIVAVSLAACGGGTPASSSGVPPSQVAGQPTASSPPAATAPPATDAPTPSRASPASLPPLPTQSPTFESPFYRYAMTIAPGTRTRNWRPASRVWDGIARLDMAGPYTDQTGTPDGGLFLFGAEAESLDAWFARVEGNGSRYHACTPAQNRLDVTIKGVPAIAFSQGCALGTTMARVAIWKDGWGIGVWLGDTPAGEAATTRDRLIELLDGLEWRTG